MAAEARRILVVFANPRGTNPLRLGEEDRAITDAIRRSKHRDQLLVTRCHAATVHDLSRALLDEDYDIVQISGHGTRSGLVLEQEDGSRHVVPQSALAELLAAYAFPAGSLQCAILNACYSLSTGTLASLGVPHTIAMEGPVSDDGAIEFARGFYDAIGAGKTIQFAYEEGCRRVKLARPGAQFLATMLHTGESHDAAQQPPQTEATSRDETEAPLAVTSLQSSVLVGWAIDLSDSMRTNIRNDSGGVLTRFEGFRAALDRLASDAKQAVRECRIGNDGRFDVFAYGFGLRHRAIDRVDLLSLLRASRDLVDTTEIERLKQKHSEAVRCAYQSMVGRYADLNDLVQNPRIGGVLDSIASRISSQAEAEIRQRVVFEIASRLEGRLHDLGETTLSLEDFAHLWDDSGSGFGQLEELVFGATPMCGALADVKRRFKAELATRPADTAATLFILSDGEPTDGSPGDILQEIKALGVVIISCFVTAADVADPRALYGQPAGNWPRGARLMFEAASTVKDESDVVRFLLRKGWTIHPDARLFVQLNHSAVLNEFMETLLVPLRRREADWQLPAGELPVRPR